MSRRILGMRTTNWTSLSNSRPSRTSTRLDRGEYEWSVVIMDKNDRPQKRLTIRADDMDQAVAKSLSLVEIGQAVTVDGRRFTK
jgi:hypothetical protein